MEDATFELMAGEQRKVKGEIAFISDQTYNIDDMDAKFCMISLSYTGCYCLRCTKLIDPARRGMVEIDGEETEPPLIETPNSMFGQIIAIHVRRYLRQYDREYHIVYRGAFDVDGEPIEPFAFTLKTLPRAQVQFGRHDELVLQAARECMVLLKNDGALPLGKGACVNAFGAASVVFRSGCLGAGKINPRYGIRVKEGIEQYSGLCLNEALYEFYTAERDVLPPEEMLADARARSDTALVFISRSSSEAHDMPLDKGGYYLTDEERSLLTGVRERFPKTVVILNTAYPIEMGWAEQPGISAVLWTGLCGMAGGRALAEILEGRVNPSGKLACTWAYDYSDYPTAKNFLPKEEILRRYGSMGVSFSTIAYEEGMYVGYRYFTQFGKPAAFLFGHGMSYTSFDKEVISAEYTASAVCVRVKVTNSGKAAGKEVCMLYAAYPELSDQPVRLVAFGKTGELAPGEECILELTAKAEDLSVYEQPTARFVLPRRADILLGGTPDRALTVYRMEAKEDAVVRKSFSLTRCPVALEELSGRTPTVSGTWTRAYFKEETDGKLPYKAALPDWDEPCAELTGGGETIPFDEVAAGRRPLTDFVAQLSVRELARLIVGGKTGWGVGDKGYAGSLERGGGMERYGLPEYYFADGNNGVNVNQPNIGFPTSGAMCSTWNMELVEQEGQAIAEEARAMGLNCILAPAMNIQRDPLCGRHSEYFSEDPFLAGTMAGHQAKGLEAGGVAACIKHLFANNCELMRNTSNSLMTERTAREIYLRAFETAFRVHMPKAVMTSYNAVNGVYPADDPRLLIGWLRGELGFDGVVMTDWNGYGDEGVPAIVRAGIGWVAPGAPDDTYVAPIVEAVERGELSKALLQRRAMQLLKVVLATL